MTHPSEDLLSEIDGFLAQTGIAPSIFGRDAVGDPNLLRNLRAGRELRSATAKRVRDFITSHQVAA
jgi:hypothetical protein